MIVGLVASQPDVAVAIDVDAVLALRPLITSTGSAPASQQFAVGRKLQHGRRGRTAAGFGWRLLRALLIIDERRWPVNDPDRIALADRDARDLTEDHVIRQRFWPGRDDGVLRGRGGLLREGREW